MRLVNSPRSGWSRRAFLEASAAGIAALAGVSCSDSTSSQYDGDGRLSVQISPPTTPLGPGEHSLGLGSSRDGMLILPTGYLQNTPTTLMLLLHGASGRGSGIATAFKPLAEAANVAILAPDSRGRTWDLILGGFGPDVTFLDDALEWAFAHVNVDPARLTIAGFSDGGSYSLAIGLTNGTLFRRVIAFSPGFLHAQTIAGKPPVYITHGKTDSVLPIDSTSRVIVPTLEQAGYTVDYHEFDGGHVVDQTLAEQALEWAATP